MKQAGGALIVCCVLGLLVLILIGWLDPGARELRDVKHELAVEQAIELAPLQLTVKRALLAALATIGISFGLIALAAGLIAIGSVPNGIRATWLRSWLVRPGRHGALYPALARPNGQGHIELIEPINEAGAQRVAALTTGLDAGARLQGSAVRQALRQDDPQAMLPAPEPAQVIDLETATRVDPRTNPHWLMIGKTGSGKSNAMRHVLSIQAQRFPSEFVICEPNRGNWKDLAHAWTVEGIAAAVQRVYAEQQRRADLLAAHPVADHVMDLGVHMPYLCLIFAEMDATMDNLYKLDRQQHKITLVQLRDIARMGRKQGVCLFAESQAGLADVLDPNIARNFANVYLFNGSQQTARMFQISDRVSLPRLAVGTAWSVTYESLIDFPPVERPSLPLSDLYHEAVGAQLPQPATTTTGLTAGLDPVATVAELPKRQPTPDEADAMREHYRRVRSVTAVCKRFYGYKDGPTWEWVQMALSGEL